MTKRCYAISVKMRSSNLAATVTAYELYMRVNSQDLALFLDDLNANPKVIEFSVYRTVEIPALHKFQMSYLDLGTDEFEKLK